MFPFIRMPGYDVMIDTFFVDVAAVLGVFVLGVFDDHFICVE